jgi:hypothetical protein
MIAQNTNFLQRIESNRLIRKDPRLDKFFAYCDQYIGQKTLLIALS